MKEKDKLRGLGLLAGLAALLLVNVPVDAWSPAGGPSASPSPARFLRDSLDAQTGLVVAPGFHVVKNNCVRCHSPQLITAKRATREGWEATIRWMQQNQGLGNLGPDEATILDYLARHYAPTHEGRRPPLKNIKWYRLEK